MYLEEAQIVEHHAVRKQFFRMVLHAPSIARVARPGQFVHVKIPSLESATLRRPFSIFFTEGDRLALLYKVVGRGTERLSSAGIGDRISILGPLGNGFPTPASDTPIVLVAGGYGVAPLYFLARTCKRSGTVFIGGKSAAEILAHPEFLKLGWEAHVATEDGGAGFRGYVTEALDQWLRQRQPESLQIFACGPMNMLRAVALLVEKTPWKAWLSLERRMGCGVGACLSCVQRVRDGGGRWVRVCREGPVFESRQIVWEETA